MDNMLWELHGLSLFVGLQDSWNKGGDSIFLTVAMKRVQITPHAVNQPRCAPTAQITLKATTCGCVTHSNSFILSASAPRGGVRCQRLNIIVDCCVWFKSAKAERGCVRVSGNKSSSYLSLLSPLSGGARRPALGYSHYLGDVGLGSGFFSHWQHSLHCHHGKSPEPDITAAAYHTLTQTSHMQILWHGRETIYNV